MKSAEKVEQHEKITVHQGPTLTVPASSSPSDVTPSSSGANTPAKQEPDTTSNGKVGCMDFRYSMFEPDRVRFQ